MSDPALSHWTHVLIVEPGYDGWRLDRYLTEKLLRASRSQVQRWIKGGIRCNGHPVRKPGHIVRRSDRIEIDRVERRDPATPDLSSIRVVLHEEPWLVVNKPPGLLVHGTATEGAHHVVGWLSQHHPKRDAAPVHRLDRDTSGCLLCALDADAQKRARRAFDGHHVEKVYAAIVSDPSMRWPVTGQTTRLDTPLGFDRDSAVGLRIGVGDWACATHVRPIARHETWTLLALRIEGGRQHQIRAHLSLEGTPVVGDKLYGMGDAFFLEWLARPGDAALRAALPLAHHALHAASLRWTDQGRNHHVQAPLPTAWNTLWPAVAEAWPAAGESHAQDPMATTP